MCIRLYSPNFKDGFAVLHSQSETLSSFTCYFVFSQSARQSRTHQLQLWGISSISHPHPWHRTPWGPLRMDGLSPGTHSSLPWASPREGAWSSEWLRKWVSIPLQETQSLQKLRDPSYPTDSLNDLPASRLSISRPDGSHFNCKWSRGRVSSPEQHQGLLQAWCSDIFSRTFPMTQPRSKCCLQLDGCGLNVCLPHPTRIYMLKS